MWMALIVCVETLPAFARVMMAYSAGIPPLVSRLPSLMDYLDDGESALTFSPGNAEDLAGGNYPELLKLLGISGEKLIEHLTSLAEKIDQESSAIQNL